MADRELSRITLRALLRLYQVALRPLPDGRWTGRHPFSVRPGAALTLSADGGSWSTNDTPPVGGDRLDFIIYMECVTRERASDMLYEVYPSVLKREHIPSDFPPEELRRDKSVCAPLRRDREEG